MAKPPRPLIAGNWKMNGLSAGLNEPRLLAGMLKGVKLPCEVMICPPATLLVQVRKVVKVAKIKVGGQDCHARESGAHTGDIAPEMLKDAGASAVIVGHSERRADHDETDETVRAKAEGAYRAGLIAIICVGETLDERQSGQTLKVVSRQLEGSLPKSASGANTVVAYEPVWAIGTGLTPTPGEVGDVHAHIRRELQRLMGRVEARKTRILYGGSVKPSNAVELMAVPDVNGALVGGASLKAVDFIGIIKAYQGS
jgi:triosephosphate isomerase